LTYIGDVIVNGNPEVAGRPDPGPMVPPTLPELSAAEMTRDPAPGSKQLFDELGAEGFAKWMLEQKRLLITDTTMRDAHQSLFATRMRSLDITAIAPHYARLLPNIFSMECWGAPPSTWRCAS
jgi:pyruvate carboxylase